MIMAYFADFVQVFPAPMVPKQLAAQLSFLGNVPHVTFTHLRELVSSNT